MEFSGTFDLEDATEDEVWLALSDPHLVWHSLPGCQFLVRVDGDPDFDALREEYAEAEPELTMDQDVIEGRAFEKGATYAALLELSVGSISPSFETVVTVDERDQPRMSASGEGSAGNSAFEMSSGMELSEADGAVTVDWRAEADVFGRIAQMGQRAINPVANRVVKRFFATLQETLADMSEETADETATTATGDGSDEGGSTRSDDDDRTSTSGERDDERNAGGGLLARLKRLLGIGQ